jgi:hypothetical protein
MLEMDKADADRTLDSVSANGLNSKGLFLRLVTGI